MQGPWVSYGTYNQMALKSLLIKHQHFSLVNTFSLFFWNCQNSVLSNIAFPKYACYFEKETAKQSRYLNEYYPFNDFW